MRSGWAVVDAALSQRVARDDRGRVGGGARAVTWRTFRRPEVYYWNRLEETMWMAVVSEVNGGWRRRRRHWMSVAVREADLVVL